MTTFNDREAAFEAKFAHDEEMLFKAYARCNRLVGLWAAELLGKQDGDAVAYATDVVKADFEHAGHEDVVKKLVTDLEGLAGESAIREKIAECLVMAKSQLASEA